MRLVAAGLLGALLAVVPSGAVQAHAQAASTAPETAVARYQRAAARFTQLAEEARQRGTVPRRADPEVAALLDILSDYRAAFGEGAPTIEGFEDLTTLLEAANNAQSLYVNFGLADSNVMGSNGQRDRNIAAFQDEVVPLIVFGTEGNGRLLALAAQFAPRAVAIPEARQHFVAMRQLAGFGLFGTILIPTAGGVSPAHKLAMLEVGARHADSFAQAMSLADRRSALARARQVRAQAAMVYRPGLDRIIAALAREDCVGLCAL